MSRRLTTAQLLGQDRFWVDGYGDRLSLDRMDPDHRANLIPFLRGNCRTYHRLACGRCHGTGLVQFEYGSDGITVWTDVAECDCTTITAQAAEEWLEQTPLMRRLVALEAGRPIEARRATHERNQAHEKATGYRKVRLG